MSEVQLTARQLKVPPPTAQSVHKHLPLFHIEDPRLALSRFHRKSPKFPNWKVSAEEGGQEDTRRFLSFLWVCIID